MKKKFLAGGALLAALARVATGCAGSSGDGADAGDDGLITVGFAQTGSESGWRSANTESMKEAFSEENGFELIFNAADNKQEAKDAGIPVVLEDRTVSASDDLYASWVGLDFEKEGNTAGTWAADNFGAEPTKMVVLEGTTGSAPAND